MAPAASSSSMAATGARAASTVLDQDAEETQVKRAIHDDAGQLDADMDMLVVCGLDDDRGSATTRVHNIKHGNDDESRMRGESMRIAGHDSGQAGQCHHHHRDEQG